MHRVQATGVKGARPSWGGTEVAAPWSWFPGAQLVFKGAFLFFILNENGSKVTS